MKILIIGSFPPTTIRVREYNLIKTLYQLGHDIIYLSTVDSREDLNAEKAYSFCYKYVEVYVSKTRTILNLAKNIISLKPFQVAFSFHPDIKKITRQLCYEFKIDLIYFSALRSSQYISKDINIPIVYDAQDVISSSFLTFISKIDWKILFKKTIYFIEYIKLLHYEKKLYENLENIIFISNKEVDKALTLVKKNQPIPKFHVITNGVDTKYFHVEKCGNVFNFNNYNDDWLIFVGKMNYISNELAMLYFVEKIFPLILSVKPNTKLAIVGSKPSSKILSLQNERIIVTGWVKDIRPYLKMAKLFVAPLDTGGGVSNKVLEAMSMETPVVCTSKVAAPFQNSALQALSVADTPELFSHEVLSLLNNDNLLKQKAKAGREFVANQHDWKNFSLKMENLFSSILY